MAVEDDDRTLVDAEATLVVEDASAREAQATLLVEDASAHGAQAARAVADAGGTTTILVPDDAPPRATRRRWPVDVRALGAALGFAGLASATVALALFLALRALAPGPAAEPLAQAPAAPADPGPRAPAPGPRAPAPSPRAAAPASGPGAARAALPATASCTYQRGPGGLGTLVIACDVENPGPTAVRAEVVPVVHRGGVAERVYLDRLLLEPGARTLRRYELRNRPERDVGSGCACEATVAPSPR